LQPVDDVLRQVIFLLTAVCSVSWFIYTLVFRRMPVTGLLFALANLLAGGGVMLVSLRSEEASYLHFQVADWAIVAGFVAIRAGIRNIHFPKERAWAILVAPLVIEMAATAMLQPDPSSHLPRALVFNAMCALAFLACFGDLYRGAAGMKLGRFRALMTGLPLLFTGLVFALRWLQLAGAALSSSAPQQAPGQGYATFLWVFIATLITVNVSVIMVVVGDLIVALKRIADRDALTGVFSRRYLQHVLHRERERSLRSAAPLSCILLDIDHFKSVNDRYGHDAGDAALQHVCKVLTDGLRVTDTFGRQGGEEFMLICPETQHSTALEVAQRLRQSLQALPLTWHEHSITLTASFGVATLRAGDHVESLLKSADLALYQAKRLGRNTVCGEGDPHSQFPLQTGATGL